MELIEKVPFHFLKFKAGQSIFQAGEPSECLRFVVSGQTEAKTVLADGGITLMQTIAAPDVLAPDYLFGRETSYPFSLTAKTECGIMQLSKTHVVSIVQTDKICLLNMMNYLSRNAQKVTMGYKRMMSGEPWQRLAVLVFMLTGHRSTDITIRYKQKDFCKLLGMRRNAFIEAITALETIEVARDDGGELHILDRKQLVSNLINHGNK